MPLSNGNIRELSLRVSNDTSTGTAARFMNAMQ